VDRNSGKVDVLNRVGVLTFIVDHECSRASRDSSMPLQKQRSMIGRTVA
jgi:hypothetical protein